jgi:hypothetical protein
MQVKTAQPTPAVSNNPRSSLDTPYYVKACALGIPAYLMGVHLWTWVFGLMVFLGGRADFRQLYAAGYMVRTGHANQLYDYDAQKYFQDNLVSPAQMALPFIRPAYQALAFAPLSYLPYPRAYFAFLAINVAILSLIYVLLLPWTQSLRAIYPWLPLSLILGFLPLAAALIQGQDSVLLTAIVVSAFVLLAKGQDFAAGSLVGLGLFKFQIVIPIVLLFLVWRRWRFVAGSTGVLVILGSLSGWLVGAEQTRVYARSLFSMAGGMAPNANVLHYPIPLQTMANLHGFVFGIFGGRVPGIWVQAVTIFLSLAVLVWTVLRGRRVSNASNASHLLLLAIPCSVLVSYYAFIHDLSVLLLPAVLLLNSFLPYEGRSRNIEPWINRSAAFMFVALLAESFFPAHFYFVTIAIVFLLAGVSVAVRSGAYSGEQSPSGQSLMRKGMA